MAGNRFDSVAGVGCGSSGDEETTRGKNVDFTEDEIFYIETEVAPVSETLMPPSANEEKGPDDSRETPLQTPRDLKLLERFGGKVDTALEARSIVMRRRRSSSASPQSIRSNGRWSSTDPNAVYSEVATGVVVNDQDELMELIDEIEMLESMIIEMEGQRDKQQRQSSGLSRIVQKSMKASNPETMINRLKKRLVVMKAEAVNKAMQLNLLHPESPRSMHDETSQQQQRQSEEGTVNEEGSDSTRLHKPPRIQSGKDFIRQTYPDIIHKPKTRMFRPTNQTGSPVYMSTSPGPSNDEARSPDTLQMEVDRRLRTSARYVEKQKEKRFRSPSLPPPNRGPSRGWRRSDMRGLGLRTAGQRVSPSTLAPTPPPTLEERRRHCAAFFDMRNINTKDANSWLARDRQRGEVDWISGLRQYEPLNI